MIRFVASTRHTEATFFTEILLVQSLLHFQRLYKSHMSMHIVFVVPNALAEVYNPVIEQSLPNDALVFVHDDVYFDDWYIAEKLFQSLQHYDFVGVASTLGRYWGDIVGQQMVSYPPGLYTRLVGFRGVLLAKMGRVISRV